MDSGYKRRQLKRTISQLKNVVEQHLDVGGGGLDHLVPLEEVHIVDANRESQFSNAAHLGEIEIGLDNNSRKQVLVSQTSRIFEQRN